MLPRISLIPATEAPLRPLAQKLPASPVETPHASATQASRTGPQFSFARAKEASRSALCGCLLWTGTGFGERWGVHFRVARRKRSCLTGGALSWPRCGDLHRPPRLVVSEASRSGRSNWGAASQRRLGPSPAAPAICRHAFAERRPETAVPQGATRTRPSSQTAGCKARSSPSSDSTPARSEFSSCCRSVAWGSSVHGVRWTPASSRARCGVQPLTASDGSMPSVRRGSGRGAAASVRIGTTPAQVGSA
jgi:hypothetical protein